MRHWWPHSSLRRPPRLRWPVHSPASNPCAASQRSLSATRCMISAICRSDSLPMALTCASLASALIKAAPAPRNHRCRFRDQALGGPAAKLDRQGVFGAEYVALVVGVSHPGVFTRMGGAPFPSAIRAAHHARLFHELAQGDPPALGLSLSLAHVGRIKPPVLQVIAYRVIRAHLHCLSFVSSSFWAHLPDLFRLPLRRYRHSVRGLAVE